MIAKGKTITLSAGDDTFSHTNTSPSSRYDLLRRTLLNNSKIKLSGAGGCVNPHNMSCDTLIHSIDFGLNSLYFF